MELRHARYFVAVAEELNFRRAAERLHLAQPSLSTQIRLLEEDVGAKLLERDSHKVELTPAGRSFLEGCRRLLQDADDFARTARRIARGESGPLSIGFVPSLAHGLLPSVLRLFRKRFPDVQLLLSEMDSTAQIEQIAGHRIDLGFIGLGLPKEIPELEIVAVAEERLVAAIPQDHPFADKSRKAIPLKALATERFLLGSRVSAPVFNPWIIVLCQQAGFQPFVVQESGATDHRPELCRGGPWCYDITCAVQSASYGRRLFHTPCPAYTRVPLLRRAHAEQSQPGPGAFYRNRLRSRQRG